MMRRGWFGFFLAVPALIFSAGCANSNNTIQTPTGSTLTFLAPADKPAGGPDFTLTVNASFAGVPFDKTTVMQWNGQNRVTTFVSNTQVTAAITAADIAKPGTAIIQTMTKQSGTGANGLSTTLPFFIDPSSFPVPTVSSLNPSSTKFGGPDFQLVVTGTNFVQSQGGAVTSVVVWNKNNLVTTFNSATQITAAVPAALISAVGSATITVVNPGPGGGPSPSGLTFTITSTSPNPADSMNSSAASLSSNGRYVAFTSSNSSGRKDVFLRDTCADASRECVAATTRISVTPDGGDANDSSGAPSISADGRFLAFQSAATNLIDGGTRGTQVFLRDTCLGASGDCQPSTVVVSVDSSGALGDNDNVLPSISASGRFVAFVSITADQSSKKIPGSKGAGFEQVFVRDTCQGASECTPRTVRISLHNGSDAETSAPRPALSGDGRRVAVPSPAANLFTQSVAIDDAVFLALTKPKE